MLTAQRRSAGIVLGSQHTASHYPTPSFPSSPACIFPFLLASITIFYFFLHCCPDWYWHDLLFKTFSYFSVWLDTGSIFCMFLVSCVYFLQFWKTSSSFLGPFWITGPGVLKADSLEKLLFPQPAKSKEQFFCPMCAQTLLKWFLLLLHSYSTSIHIPVVTCYCSSWQLHSPMCCRTESF